MGGLLDPALLLDKQVIAVARSVFCRLWLVHQIEIICPFLKKKDLAKVIHALVTLSTGYCNILYMELAAFGDITDATECGTECGFIYAEGSQ